LSFQEHDEKKRIKRKEKNGKGKMKRRKERRGKKTLSPPPQLHFKSFPEVLPIKNAISLECSLFLPPHCPVFSSHPLSRVERGREREGTTKRKDRKNKQKG